MSAVARWTRQNGLGVGLLADECFGSIKGVNLAVAGALGGGLGRYTPSMRYLLLEEIKMNEEDLEQMSNLVAEMFRIEKSATLDATVPAFISFLRWTEKAGAQGDSLKRALLVWFMRAQKPAKIITEDDAIEDLVLEKFEPMLSERIKKWQEELVAEGEAKGEAKGLREGKTEGLRKGRTEGDVEARRKVAGKMLAAGMPVARVAELTELSEDEVLAIQEQVAN